VVEGNLIIFLCYFLDTSLAILLEANKATTPDYLVIRKKKGETPIPTEYQRDGAPSHNGLVCITHSQL
jgi:hypothetical protein